MAFEAFSGDPVAELSVTPTMTCACTASGRVLWWGALPFNTRQALVDQAKTTFTDRKTECVSRRQRWDPG